jgi:hypothetical protein
LGIIIRAIFGKVWGWLVAFGALGAFLLGIYAKGRTDGKTNQQEKTRKETDAAIKEKREIEDDVANDSDSELDKRMSRWITD